MSHHCEHSTHTFRVIDGKRWFSFLSYSVVCFITNATWSENSIRLDEISNALIWFFFFCFTHLNCFLMFYVWRCHLCSYTRTHTHTRTKHSESTPIGWLWDFSEMLWKVNNWISFHWRHSVLVFSLFLWKIRKTQTSTCGGGKGRGCRILPRTACYSVNLPYSLFKIMVFALFYASSAHRLWYWQFNAIVEVIANGKWKKKKN